MTSPQPLSDAERGNKRAYLKKYKGFKISKSLSLQERDLERGHILFTERRNAKSRITLIPFLFCISNSLVYIFFTQHCSLQILINCFLQDI